MIQEDLFKYPAVPGFKKRDTAIAAAAEIAPKAENLKRQVWIALNDAPGTADEIAARLNRSILSIRPRLSELAALSLINDTGTRRENASGKRAIVWEVA